MAAIASRLKYTPEPQALPKVTYSPSRCCTALSIAEPHGEVRWMRLHHVCTLQSMRQDFTGVLCSRGLPAMCHDEGKGIVMHLDDRAEKKYRTMLETMCYGADTGGASGQGVGESDQEADGQE